MNHSEKLVYQPYTEDPPPLPMATDQDVQFTSAARKRQIFNHPQREREEKKAKIYLYLGLIQGYDSAFRIKDESGKPIYNSNIISLVNDASKRSDVLIGYDNFITLLYKANVDPEWIVNENVKSRLLRLHQNPEMVASPPPIMPPPPPPPPPEPVEPKAIPIRVPPTPAPPRPIIHGKRKLEQELEEHDAEDEWGEKEEPPNKKQWIYPDKPVEKPVDNE